MDSLILLKNRPNLEDTIEPVGLSATFLNAIVRRGPLKEESCMFSIPRSFALAPVLCLLFSAVVAPAEDTPSEQSPALPPALVEFITGAGGSAAQDLAGAAQPAAFVVAQAQQERPASATLEAVLELEFEETPEDENVSIFEREAFNQYLSIDFKNADIQNVIRLISARTGINILLDPEEVRGQITIHLDNVRLGYALDSILRTRKLAHITEQGGILRIVPESRVGRRQIEFKTEFIYLSWRSAQDMVTTFSPFLSRSGGATAGAGGGQNPSLQANEEAQVVIISDVPPNVDLIKRMIQDLDRPPRQVDIEVRLIDISIDKLRALEQNFAMTRIDSDVTDLIPSLGDVGFLPPPVNTLLPSLFSNVLLEGFAGGGAGAAVTLGSQLHLFGNDWDINAALFALETLRVVEVLENPTIRTLNNVAAHIEIQTGIPFAETTLAGAGGAPALEIKFETSGIIIDVTPLISSTGAIRLEMDLQQTVFRGRVPGTGALGPPQLDERNARTTVLVDDGETSVLGGLRSLNRNQSTSGVPWLFRIPVIGWLFKDKTYEFVKKELVLMVTPTAVDRPSLLTDRQAEMLGMIDAHWDLPDYFFDDVEMSTGEKELPPLD